MTDVTAKIDHELLQTKLVDLQEAIAFMIDRCEYRLQDIERMQSQVASGMRARTFTLEYLIGERDMIKQTLKELRDLPR